MVLKYCVDSKHLTSGIEFGIIEYVSPFDDVTCEQLRKCLDKEAKISKDAVALES